MMYEKQPDKLVTTVNFKKMSCNKNDFVKFFDSIIQRLVDLEILINKIITLKSKSFLGLFP